MTPEQFKAAREALSLSQTDLAALWGTTQRTVTRWETGKTDVPVWAVRLIAYEGGEM